MVHLLRKVTRSHLIARHFLEKTRFVTQVKANTIFNMRYTDDRVLFDPCLIGPHLEK